MRHTFFLYFLHSFQLLFTFFNSYHQHTMVPPSPVLRMRPQRALQSWGTINGIQEGMFSLFFGFFSIFLMLFELNRTKITPSSIKRKARGHYSHIEAIEGMFSFFFRFFSPFLMLFELYRTKITPSSIK
jgi:hypothetical protein